MPHHENLYRKKYTHCSKKLFESVLCARTRACVCIGPLRQSNMTVQSKIEREMYRYNSAYAASQTMCAAYKVFTSFVECLSFVFSSTTFLAPQFLLIFQCCTLEPFRRLRILRRNHDNHLKREPIKLFYAEALIYLSTKTTFKETFWSGKECLNRNSNMY